MCMESVYVVGGCNVVTIEHGRYSRSVLYAETVSSAGFVWYVGRYNGEIPVFDAMRQSRVLSVCHAGVQLRDFSPSCAVHIEGCEGWCPVVVAQWQSTGGIHQMSWV